MLKLSYFKGIELKCGVVVTETFIQTILPELIIQDLSLKLCQYKLESMLTYFQNHLKYFNKALRKLYSDVHLLSTNRSPFLIQDGHYSQLNSSTSKIAITQT